MSTDLPISAAILLKAASVVFGLLALWPALRARHLPDRSASDPDRRRRVNYLASYVLTSVSILLFAAIGFVDR